VHLITAINTIGTQPTRCVTLLKGYYGSSQRNELYAKIWRWPDLKKNELRKAENVILHLRINILYKIKLNWRSLMV